MPNADSLSNTETHIDVTGLTLGRVIEVEFSDQPNALAVIVDVNASDKRRFILGIDVPIRLIVLVQNPGSIGFNMHNITHRTVARILKPIILRA